MTDEDTGTKDYNPSANAGHCLRLQMITGKVHPTRPIHRSQALLSADPIP
jgi:hypothetical protein